LKQSWLSTTSHFAHWFELAASIGDQGSDAQCTDGTIYEAMTL
jgi:hypothetical protein